MIIMSRIFPIGRITCQSISRRVAVATPKYLFSISCRHDTDNLSLYWDGYSAHCDRELGGGITASTPTTLTFRPFSSPSMPSAPPPLFDYAIRRNFKAVVKRVRSHPHEAQFPHPRRWTALHCCAENDAPAEAMRSVYEAYPDALRTKDWRGYTPDQVASSDEGKEFFKMLAIQIAERKNVVRGNMTTSIFPSNELSGDGIHGIMALANSMGDQVKALGKSCEILQKEIDKLKETLENSSK